MTYLILDPPVNILSPRSKIEAWIERLESLSANPEFDADPARTTIESALREARSWLESSGSTAMDPASRTH